MEIRIGVVDSPKEISLEVEEKVEELIKRVDAALTGDLSVLWLKDDKDKRVGVPSNKVAYVEIDPESAPRSVGFRR
ncbi:MAG TPA: DUF3107 domain-containing protein [Actinomycetota bacterium]|nr:DUF3107 domain-containing protein [Actinomycetota bacterium]